MNRLFRTPNKSNKPSGLKSPGTAVPDAVRSMGAGAMIGANNSVDLSTKIDPYTFGTNITPSPSPSPYSTNTPSTTNTTTNNNSSTNSSAAVSPLSHIHTGLPIHAPLQTRAPSISNHGHGHPHHTHATSAADGYTDPTLVPPPARRHSLRARSSSEEPWVVVSDGGNGMDSRSGSFASSFMSDTTPGGANPASGQITPNPSLYNSNSSGPYGSSAAGTPFDVTNPSSPIQQQPQQPSQPQTQRGTGATGGAGVANTRAPAGPPKANGVYADMQNTGGTVGPVPSGGAPRAPMESMENQGYQNANFNTLRDKDKESIHSQQDKTGSWARGIFGGNTTSARDKEANVELMRMIGFLVAAAPDDWNLVLEVCDRASASESAAKEAARALRKEFSHGEPSAQLSAARLWAIMLQNANDLFILQTASRKFLENLEEVINAERTSPVVRERLLDVLASAAYTYGKKPGKEGYASTWKKVRPSWKPPEGVPFDPEDVLFGSAFPRRVPPGQVPLQQQQQQGAQYYGSQPQPPQNYGIGRGDDREHGRDSTNTGTYGRGDRDGNGRSGDRTERDKEKHRRERERDKYNLQQQRQLEQLQQQGFRTYNTPQAPPRKDRGIIPPEEDIRRLFQECDVAKNNAQVLSGALPFATPANFSSDPVIQEFYNKCRASQELIMAQIAWASAGAERSRLAAEKAAKDSGSDNGPNRLTRQAKPGREGRNNGSDDLTKEERLLAALLSASTELMEVFKEYEQLEQMARTEKEEREIAKRSMTDTRMDRTQIHLIKPDGSVVDAPAAVNAGSSSRSPSPAIPASTRSISGTTVPTVASNTAAAKGAGGRDLPLPPHMSGEHLVTPGATPITPNAPINYPPQQQPGAPASQQQGPPYHHQHHSSTHSINNYNTAILNLPPAAPHGPRHPPSNNRSRTPSPDRPGVVSGTVPGTTSPPLMEYGPPSHPPPQHGQRGGAGGARYDSLRSGNRTESPVPGGAPPGLGGTHNVAGMRIDTDAAHRYSSDEENLMTPIRPSAKALGKRRAEVEAPPDEEELERREEEELEEAFYRSTIPVDAETPTRTVYYVYDAAAERAKELDRLEKEEQEKERLKALQARNSILRGSGGGSGTAAAAAAGGAGAQQQQPLGAVNNPRT